MTWIDFCRIVDMDKYLAVSQKLTKECKLFLFNLTGLAGRDNMIQIDLANADKAALVQWEGQPADLIDRYLKELLACRAILEVTGHNTTYYQLNPEIWQWLENDVKLK